MIGGPTLIGTTIILWHLPSEHSPSRFALLSLLAMLPSAFKAVHSTLPVSRSGVRWASMATFASSSLFQLRGGSWHNGQSGTMNDCDGVGH